jgi:multisubunit Na+/H+ antiporter MnhB subunit
MDDIGFKKENFLKKHGFKILTGIVVLFSLVIVLAICISYGTIYPNRKTRDWLLWITVGLWVLVFVLWILDLIINRYR